MWLTAPDYLSTQQLPLVRRQQVLDPDSSVGSTPHVWPGRFRDARGRRRRVLTLRLVSDGSLFIKKLNADAMMLS